MLTNGMRGCLNVRNECRVEFLFRINDSEIHLHSHVPIKTPLFQQFQACFFFFFNRHCGQDVRNDPSPQKDARYHLLSRL